MLLRSIFLGERTLPSGPLCLWQYFVEIQSNLELNLSIVFLNLQPRSRHRINIFVKGRRIMNKIMKQDENVHLAVQKQKQEQSCMNIFLYLALGEGGEYICKGLKKQPKVVPQILELHISFSELPLSGQKMLSKYRRPQVVLVDYNMKWDFFHKRYNNNSSSQTTKVFA